MVKYVPTKAIPYVVLFGAFLYNLNIGIINTYGNLNIYLTSYLRYKGQNVTYRDISFIYELTVVTLGLAMLIGPVVQKKIGQRKTILCVCFSTFLSFYICSIYTSSYYVLCLFMGVVYAIGYGIAFTIPLSCVYKHFKNNRGFISGIVISAKSLTSFIYCPIQTILINKNNILPIRTGGNPKELLFIDIDVLNRVPYVLYIQSIIFVICSTLGAFLATIDYEPTNDILTIAPDETTDATNITTQKENSLTINEDIDAQNIDNADSNLSNLKKPFIERINIKKNKKKKNKKTSDDEALLANSENINNKKCKSLFDLFLFKIFNVINNMYTDADTNLKQKTRSYYNKKCTEDKYFFFIWLAVVLFNSYVNYIIMYWKIIGITYTSVEDKLITINGSIINSIFNIAGRLVWGSICDKLKLNVALTLLGVCICSCCFLLPLITHIYYLYVIVCGFFYFSIGGSFVIIPIIALKRYGEIQFALNMSILYTTRIANTFACSLIIYFLINIFTLRCLSSAFGVIAAISVVFIFSLTKP
ncbi:monocarboxylate transporter, putative [Hepatocystis sp. ex Piliocolobus tephrosceles]|nr:monocarboxylate transporter, putative [Hepatocystis sp. ex Piliocolobus tephrosceles]